MVVEVVSKSNTKIVSIGEVLEQKKEKYKFVYKIKSSSYRNFMKGVVNVQSRRLGIKVVQKSTGSNSSHTRTSKIEAVVEQQ